jgi:hypothetical protein
VNTQQPQPTESNFKALILLLSVDSFGKLRLSKR